jgi:molybdopterin synthase catalytic subunit
VNVRVLFFATLRDRAGTREQRLDLPDGATLDDLRAILTKHKPEIEGALASAVASVNREFSQAGAILKDGDEVAFFPPVSGGASEVDEKPTLFRLTEEALDLNALLSDLVRPQTGAACVFTGVVRGQTGERETTRLEYEAYPPMARDKMEQVAAEIRARWPQVDGIAIVQRLGKLEPGSPTVLIACTAAHRDSGVFEAARYGIDRLKEIVPVWKKEVGPSGESWVEGKYRPGAQDRRQ